MVFDCVESGANEFVWETDRGVACQRWIVDHWNLEEGENDSLGWGYDS